MCGIVGMIGNGVEAGLLAGMRDVLAHRGPDGAGHWLSPDRRVGFGHRRLSILDLAEAASQPMANEDGRVVVCFNGEIYNHVSLRRELESAGHVFRSDHSDTEVLVHGFEQWGLDGLLERLSGMFAFALWDGRAGRVFLVRDRVGIKPLYFTRIDGAFAFASEIKALLAHPGLVRDVCPAALWHTLSFLTPPAPLTLFEGVFKLPAGHALELDEEGGLRRAWAWWKPLPDPSLLPEAGLSETARRDFWVQGIRERLDISMDRHLVADVPVGAFLSGGVDSSTLVGLMSRRAAGRVKTFTVGFSDYTHLNELEWARRVADHFGTDHTEVMVDAAEMEGYLDQLIHSQDEPIADWVCIPLHFVSRAVARAGVKVVQVGEGADELFGGYPSWSTWLDLHRKAWIPWRRWAPRPLRLLAAELGQLAAWARPDLGTRLDILHRAARSEGELFWTGAVCLWESQKRALVTDPQAIVPGGGGLERELVALGLLPAPWLGPDSAPVTEGWLKSFDGLCPGADQLSRMTHSELRLRLPELLLMRVDKITMAQSIEARVPFLDPDLIHFALSIPQGDKLAHGPKSLLKEAVRGLVPDSIIDRPKMGFGAPMAQWLRGEFGRKAEAMILGSSLLDRFGFSRPAVAAMIADHREGRRDSSLAIWVLFNIAAWHRAWIGESPRGRRLGGCCG